jgi:hypothetical protein
VQQHGQAQDVRDLDVALEETILRELDGAAAHGLRDVAGLDRQRTAQAQAELHFAVRLRGDAVQDGLEALGGGHRVRRAIGVGHPRLRVGWHGGEQGGGGQGREQFSHVLSPCNGWAVLNDAPLGQEICGFNLGAVA